MSLIKSISGIRGTIGGGIGDNLTPLDLVRFTTAYVLFLKKRNPKKKLKIVVGRDARISGPMVESIVVGTLVGMGADVVKLGFSTTPSVELSVVEHLADGGIIITASHNPKEWNALKLLNGLGEFLNAKEGVEVIKISEKVEKEKYAEVDNLGKVEDDRRSIEKHIEKVIALKEVDIKAITEANFSIVVDPINSTGAIAVPLLLKALGIKKIHKINSKADGFFAHNPEPLKEHLDGLAQTVCKKKADVGIAVDPDVDRLAFMCENGVLYGEEYTLVTVADYILSLRKGPAVSNLSSSLALKDVAQKYGCSYESAAVGEVNVVEKMKECKAVIGGEGNGGVIYPPLHYGRDALVGIALFLTHWAQLKKKKKITNLSSLKSIYPQYFIVKHKMVLTESMNVGAILSALEKQFKKENISKIDGLKISFPERKEWVHLRKSNTEPIIRLYAESATEERALLLAEDMVNKMSKL